MIRCRQLLNQTRNDSSFVHAFRRLGAAVGKCQPPNAHKRQCRARDNEDDVRNGFKAPRTSLHCSPRLSPAHSLPLLLARFGWVAWGAAETARQSARRWIVLAVAYWLAASQDTTIEGIVATGRAFLVARSAALRPRQRLLSDCEHHEGPENAQLNEANDGFTYPPFSRVVR
jgi:hypothetical protein